MLIWRRMQSIGIGLLSNPFAHVVQTAQPPTTIRKGDISIMRANARPPSNRTHSNTLAHRRVAAVTVPRPIVGLMERGGPRVKGGSDPVLHRSVPEEGGRLCVVPDSSVETK
jgi:hypothetical protein